ncbi:MAG: hypothetical protein GF307_11730 [candidate division Zixibacteria bacterium]|nr:hypothetical protein [candidate division Zixibacteria bacterium]
MEEKNETIDELIGRIDEQLSAGNAGTMEIKNSRALLSELKKMTDELAREAEFGKKFKDDFRERLLSRAKAIDMLKKEKDTAPFVEDALESSKDDFGKLVRLREHVDRRFNMAFELTEYPQAKRDRNPGMDYSQFKC